MLDPLLSDRDVARILRCARSSLQKSRVRGDGPPWVKLGGLVRYRPEDIAAYIASLPIVRSTSEYPEEVE